MTAHHHAPDGRAMPAPPPRRSWSRLPDLQHLELACAGTLPYLAYRLLHVLIHAADRSGHIHATGQTLASWLGSSQSMMSRSIRVLIAEGLIVKEGVAYYRIADHLLICMDDPGHRARRRRI